MATNDTQFIQKNDAKRYTLGVVYAPMEVDAHNEYATSEDIEKACWDFAKVVQGRSSINKAALVLLDSVVKALETGQELQLDVTGLTEQIAKESSGVGLGIQHAYWADGIGDIVENYIAPCDFQLAKSDGTFEEIKKGTWMLGVVWAPEYFQKVLNKEITGLSMGGTAIKVPDTAAEGGES